MNCCVIRRGKQVYIIPNSVTDIGVYAFSGCSGLTSITIPESVTSIDYYAFNNCSSLTSVIIPNSVTSMAGGAFSGCSSLTSIVIPEGVTSIGDGVFDYCDNVTLIVEKDSYAEQYAKNNDIPYQYMEIKNPDNTTEEPTTEQPTSEQPTTEQPAKEAEKVVVGNVTMVPIETETDDKPVVDNKVKIQNGSNTIKKGTVLASKTGTYKVTNVKKKTVTYMGTKNKKASSIKIPEEIKIKKKKYKMTSVSANAFKNNKKIKKVTIGQNVKEIGKNAFRGCKNLETVTIGENVTTIGNYAFYDCKKLNLIEIRSSKLKKVGKAAFKKIAKHPTARVPEEKIESYKKLFEGTM